MGKRDFRWREKDRIALVWLLVDPVWLLASTCYEKFE